MSERPTIPAESSRSEADHWLLVECHIGRAQTEARGVRAAIVSGEAPAESAAEWLRRVASLDTMQGAWARMFAAELGVS